MTQGSSPGPSPSPVGLIPPSAALAEADPLSLSELFATSPEQMLPGSPKLKEVVARLRKMYASWAQAEAQPKLAKPRGAKAPAKLSGPVQTEGLDF